ncbi:YDG/SRA domain-containing protein [Hymenobacter persicinus]|uniref:HNH endonuclease n=1 Tax=Hymenobacter persicinus TaxID=2025506 RepID=A0A4Q5LBE1_9BACT|nr:YDG/SRA domain-containing protein [Hymenobacter persicinus]RYU79700.1 HNH endonuclease [Hymenobacter persicinus]
MAKAPAPIVLGAIAGVLPGHEFRNRKEVKAAGLHRDWVKGISHLMGNPAEAIVLSGGYEDDFDAGGTILYTGEGGNQDKKQVADQTLMGGNLSLHLSFTNKTPVRVIRKIRSKSLGDYYQYAGLYSVTSCEYQRGRSGFMIWRFLLEQIESEELQAATVTPEDAVAERAALYTPVPRRITTAARLVRDTRVMRRVKDLYEYHCQVCGNQLANGRKLYAEAAHVQPLGSPHHGPDTLNNLLCLCPNHHVLLDMGAWSLEDNFSLAGLAGQLVLHPAHGLRPEWAQYHRRHIFHKN